jgi:predicted PurR-regulated permease PerM
MNHQISPNAILWFFLACFIASLIMLGWLLLPFYSIIILAGVLTGLFHPVYTMLQFNGKVRPSLASSLTCALIFLIIFIPIVFFVGVLTQEAFGLYQLARDAVLNDQIKNLLANSAVLERINRVTENFNFQVTGDQLQSAISDIGKVVGLFLYDQARAIASNTFAFVVDFLLMLLVIFFLLLDGQRLISFIIDISPLPSDQEHMLIRKFNDMTGAILVVNGLSGLIQGTFGGVAFWLFGFESAFLWGVIMGLLAFLPIIGTGAVMLPTFIYLLLKARIAAAISLLVFYLFMTSVIEYMLKPRLVGQRVQMHTLLVFFAVIGGLKLFGILGIIYGPLVVTAFLTLADIYKSSYQQFVEPH